MTDTTKSKRETPETAALGEHIEALAQALPSEMTLADLKVWLCAIVKRLSCHAKTLERQRDEAREEKDASRRALNTADKTMAAMNQDRIDAIDQAEQKLAEVEADAGRLRLAVTVLLAYAIGNGFFSGDDKTRAVAFVERQALPEGMTVGTAIDDVITKEFP